MKYSQIIALTLSLIPFAVPAEPGIGSEQAAQSFRNSLSPQHKMQNLLGSPKFDAIGTQPDESLDEAEPAPKPRPKRAAPPPAETIAPKLELGEMQSFTGKLVKAEWQKTTASYCQGGSTHYELVVKDTHYIVNSLRDPIFEKNSEDFDKLQAQLAKLEGQTITLQGQTVTRHFSQAEHCPNPMMQCIAGELTCDWLRVTDVVAK